MKKIFLLIIITSCANLSSFKIKYSLELAESIKIESSQLAVENLIGKPHKIIDLSNDTKNSNLIGWYYYNSENNSQFNLAIFFDSSSKNVQKVTWTPDNSQQKITLKNLEQRYPSVNFKKIEKWLGAHEGRSHTFFESKDPHIVVVVDPLSEIVKAISFR